MKKSNSSRNKKKTKRLSNWQVSYLQPVLYPYVANVIRPPQLDLKRRQEKKGLVQSLSNIFQLV